MKSFWHSYSAMMGGAALLGAAGVMSVAPAQAQQPKPAAKAAAAPAKAAVKAPIAPRTTVVTRAPARSGPPRGPIEKYDCKIGTEDQHARMALMAQGGQVQSIAYYGKWKPRTCSVSLERGDSFTHWSDTGDATNIKTEFGEFLVKASKGDFQVFFREVDRMHYCGMMGKLNGSMVVARGPKHTCTVEGIMDRNPDQPLDEQADSGKQAEQTEQTQAPQAQQTLQTEQKQDVVPTAAPQPQVTPGAAKDDAAG